MQLSGVNKNALLYHFCKAIYSAFPRLQTHRVIVDLSFSVYLWVICLLFIIPNLDSACLHYPMHHIYVLTPNIYQWPLLKSRATEPVDIYRASHPDKQQLRSSNLTLINYMIKRINNIQTHGILIIIGLTQFNKY